MSLTKNECKSFSIYKSDGRLTKYYGHPLLRYITRGQIILLCMTKNDNYKVVNIVFPLVKQCPTSIFHTATILKQAEKSKFHIIKKKYDIDTFGLCFHKKDNKLLAKLNVYLDYCGLRDQQIKKDINLIIMANMLIRGDKSSDIRGRYLHHYLYNRSFIPLTKDVQTAINKEKRNMIRTCRGEQIPFSSEKEYLLRYKIAKKMTNNFEKFDKALKEYKVKAKQFIEKTKKSKEFKQFCETVHSVPFKFNFIELLKEAKQEYLIIPELKKKLRSLK